MRRLVFISSVIAISALLLAAAAQKEHYLATVLLPPTMQTSGSGPTTQLDIGIEGYTPDTVMNDLGAILGDGNNQSGLLRRFEKMQRSGWVALPGQTGLDVKVIREKKTAQGREITLVTDRPIRFWEAMNSPVTQMYPYGMMKFTVNDKGEGSGKIYPIVGIKAINADDIKINDYGVIPLEIPRVVRTK